MSRMRFSFGSQGAKGSRFTGSRFFFARATAFPAAFFLLSFFFVACFSDVLWAANDSAEAFMSATFGLSSARTKKRMEQSGAVAADFVRNGKLTMKGTFEYRPAIFFFGFHAKKGLNQKTTYIASSGTPQLDRALYDALRQAYGIRFGATEERVTPAPGIKGRIMLSSAWKPDKNTTIALSYNPEIANRFPGESPGDYPIHLSYIYTKWDK